MLIFFKILLVVMGLMMPTVVLGRRGPHHPHSTRRKNMPVDEHIAPNDQHLKEDIHHSEHIDPSLLNSMSEDEKKTYYFKMHDLDRNDMLDGLELLYAATHHNNQVDEVNNLAELESDSNHIIDVIDDFITLADTNQDGFLDYPEYIKTMVYNVEGEQSAIDSNLDAVNK